MSHAWTTVCRFVRAFADIIFKQTAFHPDFKSYAASMQRLTLTSSAAATVVFEQIVISHTLTFNHTCGDVAANRSTWDTDWSVLDTNAKLSRMIFCDLSSPTDCLARFISLLRFFTQVQPDDDNSLPMFATFDDSFCQIPSAWKHRQL